MQASASSSRMTIWTSGGPRPHKPHLDLPSRGAWSAKPLLPPHNCSVLLGRTGMSAPALLLAVLGLVGFGEYLTTAVPFAETMPFVKQQPLLSPASKQGCFPEVVLNPVSKQRPRPEVLSPGGRRGGVCGPRRCCCPHSRRRWWPWPCGSRVKGNNVAGRGGGCLCRLHNIQYIMLPLQTYLPLPATEQQNNKARPTPTANPEKDRARKAM